MKLERTKILAEKIRNNISKVIIGKDNIIELVLVSLFCSGHVLLEDVPGTGKTVLAKCLAKSIQCGYKRIQFTPDLLPSDLTGINFFNQKQGDFVFRPGPLFTNIVLADEINRATPRTQASLLECMEEGQITIDGETRALSQPFFVIATQNPVETQGTFPLPEAQLDRFFMKLKMGYPIKEDGIEILNRFQRGSTIKELDSIATVEDVLEAQQAFSHVRVSIDLREYIVNIIELTRSHDRIALGVSPRGSLALLKAAQVYAVFQGRDYITPDDVKYVAEPVLAHRIILKDSLFTKDDRSVVSDILRRVQVPVEEV